MALFARKNPPAFGAEPVKAAAGAAAQTAYINQTVGFTSFYDRNQAIQNATISRARDLIVSMVSGLPINQYGLQWMGEEYEEVPLPGETWMSRPDPNVTRQFLLAWTTDDLYFHGHAVWYVTSRSKTTNFPLSFQWLPMNDIQALDMSGDIWPRPSSQLTYNGIELDMNNVVQFLSPIQGLLYAGWRELEIANRLDTAAMRFATNEITAGYLQQTAGSEPMEAEDLADLAAAWSSARRRNAIGALNSAVEWKEFSSDPSKLQLVEARRHTMSTLANLANVPQYLVGADTGSGMTYQNAVESQKQLYYYGAKPYIDCLSQRLSMDDILPRGRFCRVDVSEFIREPEMEMGPEESESEPTREPA